MSADGLVYEFVLRKGVRFQNGDPVTAEDAKFSFRRDGRERAHRGRVTVGRDGDVMLGGPAIDARGPRIDPLEE